MKHSLLYRNEFIDTYMRMVEDTESPRVYHVWSALSGVAACIGRKMWFPWGSGRLFPNLYVLLVGSPAARKSTAMEITQDLLMECTNIRFAQDDCGGKRQGLIALMLGDEFDEDEINIGKQLEQALEHGKLTPDALAGIEVDMGSKKPSQPDCDKHVVMVASTEFNNFIGHGNLEFLEFLARMYDGKAYRYQLKNRKEKMVMADPLITLIGCTTPTNIAEAMPAAAVGQGFMSRTILVHGTAKHKDLETLPELPPELVSDVQKRFSEIYYNLNGIFVRTRQATDFSESIYNKSLPLNDGRFVYYMARRHTHFLKLSMVFAASRLSTKIELQDVEDAHALLLATEKTMPDALGEYGLNPISAAKQKILDFIVHAKDPITFSMLQQFMHRDLRLQELIGCVNDLCTAGKIQRIESKIYGMPAFIPLATKTNDMLELMDKVATAPTTEITQ